MSLSAPTPMRQILSVPGETVGPAAHEPVQPASPPLVKAVIALVILTRPMGSVRGQRLRPPAVLPKMAAAGTHRGL